jgi:saccharopine dehydrogenase-like NADP-dependent oxidoreductase
MNEEAKKKSVLFLNEMGLDPGIDHLATVRVIDEVHKKGGKYSNRLIKYTIRILEYESWCGGLPAPEFTDNPFGYKFSWSPLAAIKNINNDGVYLENNKEKYIPASHLLYSR